MKSSAMKSSAIALLAKAPVPGRVKTRFTPPFTPEQAADYAKAFLLDSVEVSGAFAASVDLWASYLGDSEILRALLPFGTGLLEQRGDRLDDRISNAVIDLRFKGYTNVIVVAADCPTIDQMYFQAALNALDYNDVVLGPAEDGGCVLVGVGAKGPDVFLDIKMSTNTVFSEMLERAETAGALVKVLPLLHDIDTIEELWAADRKGQLAHARNTQRLLWRTGVTH